MVFIKLFNLTRVDILWYAGLRLALRLIKTKVSQYIFILLCTS